MYVRRRSKNPWRVIAAFFLTLAVVIIWATTLQNGDPNLSVPAFMVEGAGDVRSYFPAQPGMVWHYAGEGAEYADFSRHITAVQGDLILLEEVTTGTTVGAVYSLSKERSAVLVSVEEYAAEERDLFQEVDSAAPAQRILLQTPIAVGTHWQDEVGLRQITAVLPEMTVPAGTFYDVVAVQTTPHGEEWEHEITEYYALNVGLIRRDFAVQGETPMTISSYLYAYGYHPPEAQSVDED